MSGLVEFSQGCNLDPRVRFGSAQGPDRLSMVLVLMESTAGRGVSRWGPKEVRLRRSEGISNHQCPDTLCLSRLSAHCDIQGFVLRGGLPSAMVTP